MPNQTIIIGIIGGSGLDDPKLLSDFEEVEVDTPWGKPSSLLTVGKLNGVDVCIIARHGKEHKIPPTGVNFRANIQALKDQGCSHIIATTACGSLRKEINRGHLVIPDQFIDFTRHRTITFFQEFPGGAGNAKHTAMADPFSPELRDLLIQTCKDLKIAHHEKGTVVTIEGPRFSTRAESRMFRGWGGDVINMSVAPEAILANEAGMPYAAIAMSTDYDCWKEDEKPVTWDEILEIFEKNVDNVKKVLIQTIPKIGKD